MSPTEAINKISRTINNSNLSCECDKCNICALIVLQKIVNQNAEKNIEIVNACRSMVNIVQNRLNYALDTNKHQSGMKYKESYVAALDEILVFLKCEAMRCTNNELFYEK